MLDVASRDRSQPQDHDANLGTRFKRDVRSASPRPASLRRAGPLSDGPLGDRPVIRRRHVTAPTSVAGDAPARDGWTFAELLVVLAILALLLALLLPALAVSRRASSQLVCQQNLRGWGQAVHAFLAARQRLPPAATWRIGEHPRGFDLPARHSLFTYLLPYCDEVTLAATLDLSRDWNDPRNDRWTHQDLAGIFLCPAAPDGRTGKHVTDYTTAIRIDPALGSGLGHLVQQGLIRDRSQQGAPGYGAGQRVWEGLLALDQIDYRRGRRDRRAVRPRDAARWHVADAVVVRECRQAALLSGRPPRGLSHHALSLGQSHDLDDHQ